MFSLRFKHTGLAGLSFSRAEFKALMISGDIKAHRLVNYELVVFFGKRALFTVGGF